MNIFHCLINFNLNYKIDNDSIFNIANKLKSIFFLLRKNYNTIYFL